MDAEAPIYRRPAFWAAVLVIWTIPVLISAGIVVENQARQGAPVPFWRALVWVTPYWYTWAILTPFVLWLGERFPVVGEKRRRIYVPLHLLFSLFFAGSHLLGELVGLQFTELSHPAISFWQRYRRLVQFYLEQDVLLYGAILGIGYGLDYYRRYLESSRREERLRSQLMETRLLALKTQLQPHFLFNTLHSISALVGSDAPAARRMLAGLGELLRRTLDSEGVQEVAFEEELVNLDTYLSIERERFPDRLEVELLVDDQVLNARVPNLVLQPLVENAIRHGISERASGGRVRIEARREADRIRISVVDDGVGVGEDGLREGIGLRNTRERLTEMYDGRQTFRVFRPEAGGFGVELILPFQDSGAGE
ncbi:MAG: sensor histidine kinase [Gemmatimonadota bacterium]